jgi:PRTRC genetic system protein E
MTTGFFTALAQYTKHAKLNLILSETADGQMTLIVMPEPKNGSAEALTKPVRFTATPAEMDQALIDGLAQVGKGYDSLAQTIEATRLLQERDAKEAVAKAAAAKVSKPGVKVLPQATQAASEDANGDDKGAASPSAVSGAPAPTGSAGNLFDL